MTYHARARPEAADALGSKLMPAEPTTGTPALECVLTGGFVNQVTRVDDTVRRNAGPWTPTIHRLLSHVRSKGVSWVPEPRGFDELGREVLSFIPGEVPHEMPKWVWSDSVLSDVGRALRKWHDATLDFDVTDALWNLPPRGAREVICHNDFAPYNCVFHEGRFVGAIDFDMCAPGPRSWDLAYTAYRFVPLMPGAAETRPGSVGELSPFSRATMSSRLRLLLQAYGSVEGPAQLDAPLLLSATAERLDALADWTAEHVRANGVAALEAHAAMYREHAGWLRTWRETALLSNDPENE